MALRQRKEHVITASRSQAQPRRLIGLAVDVDTVAPALAPGQQEERLARWAVAGWSDDKEGQRHHWRCASADVGGWWRASLWGLNRPGVTWVVCHRATRVLSLLGAWERVESGKVVLGGGQQEGREDRDGLPDRLSEVQRRVSAGQSTERHVGRAVHDVQSGDHTAANDQPRDSRIAGSRGAVLALDDPPTVVCLRVPGCQGTLQILDVRNYGIEEGPWRESADRVADWLLGAMTRMIEELTVRKWGGLARTAGSQALVAWRKSYLTHPVVAYADEGALALESAAYVGGRCECAYVGTHNGPIFYLDRVSSYGATCAEVLVPVAITGKGDGPLPLLREAPDEAGNYCAEVSLVANRPDYPARTKAGIIYPTGRVMTTLAGPELADAVRAGAVYRVLKWVRYECQPALRAYALDLYRARVELSADDALKQWVKRLIVALPGKMGQRDRRWLDAPEVPLRWGAHWLAWWESHHKDGPARLRAIAGQVQRQRVLGWGYDAVPSIAAWILSAARVALLQAIRTAGEGHVLYWDTDAVHVTAEGLARLQAVPGMVGNALGQWNVKGRFNLAEYRGVKHYVLDGAITCAGQPRVEDRESALRDHYWYRQTFGVALHEGHAPAAKRQLRRYVRSAPYRLGRVGPGGWVVPHYVEMW